MTSLSSLDLDTVVREIAETTPTPEPSPELVAKAGAYLERRGWTRSVAGEADFAAASHALARCSVQRLGIFAFGRYGCGKTALMRAIRPLFRPVHFVPLNDPEIAALMDEPEWNGDAIRCSVILDDLGAESAVTDYGIKRETAADPDGHADVEGIQACPPKREAELQVRRREIRRFGDERDSRKQVGKEVHDMADDAKGDAGKAAPGSERSALEAVESLILRTRSWKSYARLYQHYRGRLLRLFGQMTEGS